MTNTQHLPAALKESALFCVWKKEERGGKPTKIPYNPITGGKAQPNNKTTFAPFEAAAAVMGNYDGLGIGIFDGLCAIDIDHCIKDGKPSEMAADIISTMDSYTEYSPSGSGVHIYFTVSAGFRYDKAKYYINNQKSGLEAYISGATQKYVTVTGNTIGTRDIMERGKQLQKILDKYMLRRKPDEVRGKHGQASFTLSDDEVLKIAAGASNGVAFMQLWNGDTSGHSSHSEADLALCNMLAFYTGKDAAQIDRLFRQSGLMRPKWNRPQSGSTYGAITITEAISGTKEVYRRSRKSAKEDFRETKLDDALKPQPYDGLLYEPMDDGGNAARITGTFGDVFRSPVGLPDWYYWDGMRWKRDEAGQVNVAAWYMVREFQREATKQASADDSKAAQAVLKYSKQCGNVWKIESMVKALSHMNKTPVGMYDTHYNLLNCKNGVVDLRTGEIRPHDRELYLTQLVPFPYDPAAKCPAFEKTLREIFNGDMELVHYVQCAFGYMATGETKEQCFFAGYGTGANGKSTLINALRFILGEYTQTVPTSILMENRNDGSGATPELAAARNARIVQASESSDRQKLNENQIKQLTGDDVITARLLYSAPFEFTPHFKIWLNTNHKPTIIGSDEGIWRRVKMIPFTRTFTEKERDKDLGRKLEAEAGGILAWIVAGAVEWYKNGLPKCVAVDKATEDYRSEMDVVQAFLDDCAECGGEMYRTQPAQLYSAFLAWAEMNGETTMNSNTFGRRMTERGFKKDKSNGKRFYKGIRLTAEGTAIVNKMLLTNQCTPFG